ADDPAYSRLPAREPLLGSPFASGGGVGPLPEPVPALLESEFGPDGRAAAALTRLRRLDLNRYLPDYPHPDVRTRRISDATGFLLAQTARQPLAGEIFELLWRVTGTGDPALAPPPESRAHDAARWGALRWLAQLAVNVVDFVDADDYMTPFNWFSDARTGRQEWVYGTELPRVVLNEVYAEYVNLPSEPGLKRKPPQATRLRATVWVALSTRSEDDPPLTAPHRKGEAALEMPRVLGQAGYGIYRLVLARLSGDLRQPDNVRGEISPTGGIVLSTLSTFSPRPGSKPLPAVDTRAVLPADP